MARTGSVPRRAQADAAEGGRPRRAGRCPGVWRLRLPLPLARRPALQRLGARRGRRHRARRLRHARAGLAARSSSARSTRSDSRSSDVRLLVCTHAHADHCGQAADLQARTGCELWMHPRHEHVTRRRGPGGGAGPRGSRSPARAACPRRRCGAGRSARRAAEPAWPAPLAPDRDLVAGRTVETDLGRVDGARDARPRALARRAAPARAPAAALRRPRARPHLALLRLRLDARPGRRVPGLARPRRRASTSASRCRATAARSPTSRARRGQPRARRASGSPRSRAALRRRAERPPSSSLPARLRRATSRRRRRLAAHQARSATSTTSSAAATRGGLRGEPRMAPSAAAAA